ncbi:unnamed protein product [Staurois parvus]|uniref:Uncharacterized protein n=1 Tax=Staurois parvus TaxID=386267 RepID=A0ABN9HTX7_9NEOB|nr:unnamed protein product [Staurois parvus]
MEASGGIGREGWRTLNGGQWRDWQRGVEDTDSRPVEDWQRGMEDTEWRVSGGIGREGWRTLSGGQ